jgi:hypothetical protein
MRMFIDVRMFVCECTHTDAPPTPAPSHTHTTRIAAIGSESAGDRFGEEVTVLMHVRPNLGVCEVYLIHDSAKGVVRP